MEEEIKKRNKKKSGNPGFKEFPRPLQFMGMEDMMPLIISRIEKNQRHVCDAELRMLAKALHVSMEWLVGDSNEITLK